MPSSPFPSSIILHGRRPRLSAMQTHLLAHLLARPGRLVEERELPVRGIPLYLQISRIRSVVAPHGVAIYRVPQHGFVLLVCAEAGLP